MDIFLIIGYRRRGRENSSVKKPLHLFGFFHASASTKYRTMTWHSLFYLTIEIIKKKFKLVKHTNTNQLIFTNKRLSKIDGQKSALKGQK